MILITFIFFIIIFTFNVKNVELTNAKDQDKNIPLGLNEISKEVISNICQEHVDLNNSQICRDCHLIKTNDPEQLMLSTSSNKEQTSDTALICGINDPNCVKSETIDLKSIACYTFLERFPCFESGYYPTPYDCSSFYYCSTGKNFALPQFCPNGFFFNIKTVKCQRKVSVSQCFIAECLTGGSFTYNPNPQYYYTCDPSSLVATMHRCYETEKFFNNSCYFACTSSRNFPHENPTKYYECYRKQGKWEYLVKECQSGNIFDKIKRRCIVK